MQLGTELDKFSYKFPTSSLQVPYNFCTSLVQMSCRKTDSVDALQVLTQEYVAFVPSVDALYEIAYKYFLQVPQIETCRHLVQATYVARD